MADKLTKIDIITRPSMLEKLKSALNEIGVTGMTVSQVQGCGNQKGYTEIYRGHKIEVNLLQKIKFEMVVCEVPVDLVVETAKKF